MIISADFDSYWAINGKGPSESQVSRSTPCRCGRVDLYLSKKMRLLAHERIQDTFRRFSKTIRNLGGITHEIRGDALVAEFTKASDAISASLTFQTTNDTLNEQLPGDIRPMLRIGIAMGEVVIANNTVTGEGIVLAQRLEQMAETGGVCLQGAAYETLPKWLPFDYQISRGAKN